MAAYMTAASRLPLEIAYQICSQEILSKVDLQALRLVSRRWTQYATPLLFRQIRISKLISDRESFLQIAASPHLATLVRVLVWEELAEGDYSFNDLYEVHDHPRLEVCDEEIELYDDLALQACELFWWPAVNVTDRQRYDETEKAQSRIIVSFRDDLDSALESMPNLHSFVSRPMDPARQMTRNPGHYPHTAQMFKRDLPEFPTARVPFHPLREEFCQLRNEGFFGLLLPVMNWHGSARPLITRLSYVDEGPTSAICSLRDVDPKPFSFLTHIDLCLSHSGHPSHFHGLAHCLRAADHLESLRLCEAHGYCSKELETTRYSNLNVILGDSKFHSTALRCLHLVEVWFDPRYLASFIQRHATTLRFLRVDGVMTPQDLLGIAKVANLQLDSLIITPSNVPDSDTPGHIPEALLLQLVNQEWPRQAPVWRNHFTENVPCIYTQLDAPSPATVCDRYLIGRIKNINDDQDLSWNYAEYEHLPLASRHPPPMGNDEGIEVVHNMEDAERELDQNVYASELLSHMRRENTAPRWLWSYDQNDPDAVYYWVATPEDQLSIGDGQRTVNWYFHHRDGSGYLGSEPLEFWEDWEGSDAGDTYDPTPFGWPFYRFLLRVHEVNSENNEEPPWPSIPYERATRFEAFPRYDAWNHENTYIMWHDLFGPMPEEFQFYCGANTITSASQPQ